MGFNPLYIGSVCNKEILNRKLRNIVSIPFISGQFVMKLHRKSLVSYVSIPFISGQFVIIQPCVNGGSTFVSIPFISGQFVINFHFKALIGALFQSPLYRVSL